MSSVGKIIWTDLTVPNAQEVRDFYQNVAGWTFEPVEMGDYADFSMLAADGSVSTGICHRLGVNKDLPTQWLVYISVADLDASIRACEAHGGKVIDGPRAMGEAVRFCVIQDPAGAVAALIEGG